MVQQHIGRVTRASRYASRTISGEDRIPAVWRARVVYVRETEGANPAGVYVTVPNFTRGEIHGPVQVVGDAPAEGDLVVAVAVEGRKNDWIIITGQAATDIEARLTQVEALASATRDQLDILDDFVEHQITARMGRIEWDVDEVLAPRLEAVEAQAQQNAEELGNNVFNRLGAHELALEVAEERLDALDPGWEHMNLSGPWVAAPDLAPPMWRIAGGHLELRGHVTSDERGELFVLPDDVPPTQIEDTYITLVNGGEAMSIRATIGTNGRVFLAGGPLRGMDRYSANFSFNALVPLSGVRLPI